jgi:hypothetical protein
MVPLGTSIVDCPNIPWDGRAARGWQSLDWLLHQGERDGCDPKRAVLLHPFGSNFQAEDAFAGYLMPELG